MQNGIFTFERFNRGDCPKSGLPISCVVVQLVSIATMIMVFATKTPNNADNFIPSELDFKAEQFGAFCPTPL